MEILEPRRLGKSAAMEQAEADLIKKHPDAVIFRVRANGETIIEKPVKAVEPKLITDGR